MGDGHMVNGAYWQWGHRGNGIQGVWDTWVMGHMGNGAMGYGVQGHMGNGTQGTMGYRAMGTGVGVQGVWTHG